MMTSAKYCVVWCYREADCSVRRVLYHSSPEPCIEAARLIWGNPFAFNIEVLECDTGKAVDWKAPGIGRILTI